MLEPAETAELKLERFQNSLSQFTEKISADRHVLAVVLNGSLNLETIWRSHCLAVWVIETDGVTRRLRSDGNDERIHRIFVENEINIHAEIIPRSRFKQMVEGSSRTAFSCNFFASRAVVYCQDPSIESWFEQANTVATKDQERELLMFSTWTFYALRHAQDLLKYRADLKLIQHEIINAAHSLAYTEVIRSGIICEDIVIYRAMKLNPELFQKVYSDVLTKPEQVETLDQALIGIQNYLEQHYQAHLKPLIAFLKKEDRVVPLSEISDHFAFSQVYPWHLEAACEWLCRHGKLQKLSTPFKITKRSPIAAEEPAYYFEG